jgi:hypothetical protein
MIYSTGGGFDEATTLGTMTLGRMTLGRMTLGRMTLPITIKRTKK